MTTKNELREKRSDAYASAERMLDKAKVEKRDLSPVENKRYQTILNDMRSLDSRLEKLDADAASNIKVETAFRELMAQPDTRSFNGAKRPVFGEARSALIPSRAEYQDLQSEQRALGSSNSGVLLTTGQANEWFDRLRSKSVFLDSGPKMVTVGEHAVRYPLISASVTVSSRNDLDAITPTDPSLASITLEPVSYAAMTLIANEVLADTNGQAREIVSTDLVRQAATAIEADLFNGVGATSPHRIYGLLKATGTQTVAATTALTIDHLLSAQSKLEAAGAERERIAFYLNPAGWASIRGTKDSTGRYLLMPDLANADKPSLFGSKVFVTANMPAANALAVDLDQVVVGVGEDLKLAYSEDYAFNTNSTAIRLTTRLDLAILNALAVCKVTGII
ncbi:phage major capsid protein [Cryobacterium sp. Hh11]|uniref:phage major capsid protein n=1 Tax=Cryobacterium sp. Hh11 TaxID=2555868 RepID=UPI00106BB7CC|nr:phage major capsid protein [Cryobacterium sp. Hh11]TFD53210.1 phage major capsid protein [Cryobacterium sp. Hh11]